MSCIRGDEAHLATAVACLHYKACVLHIEIFNVRVRRLLRAAAAASLGTLLASWSPAAVAPPLPPAREGDTHITREISTFFFVDEEQSNF